MANYLENKNKVRIFAASNGYDMSRGECLDVLSACRDTLQEKYGISVITTISTRDLENALRGMESLSSESK